jgi:hypothetical protein
MKLKTVRIRMFRNILDSTEVTVQPDVTCLVGKNESGKTAFMQALWRLRPARTNPKFSIPEQYPAWLEKRHRLEGQDLSDVRPVETTFAWEPEDQRMITSKFGHGIIPEGAEVFLWKNYGNAFVWKHGCDEGKAVANLLGSQKLPEALEQEFTGIKTFLTLKSRIADLLKTYAADLTLAGALKQLEVAHTALLGGKDFDAVLWAIVEPRVPQFLYFADYSKLPYTVKIDRVLKAGDDQLNESEATARALLRLGGAEQDYLLNPEYERRKRELENVANTLTDDVLKYWSQNKDLRVQPEITQRTEQRPNPNNS